MKLPRQSRSGKSPLVPALLGGSLALAVVAGYLCSVAPARLPAVTRDAYDAALDRWRENKPHEFQIRVQVDGPQPGQYEVRVEGGVARWANYNGERLTNPRIVGTWSVAGMFASIERDLLQQQRAREQQDISDLSLYGNFHADYGFPTQYQRLDWGNQFEVEWKVLEFRVDDRPASEDTANP